MSSAAEKHELLSKITNRITDPAKQERLQKLDLDILNAIVTPNWLTTEKQMQALEQLGLLELRLIYQSEIIYDWGSERANEMQKQILEFISDITFVDYHDFETSYPASVAENELMCNHYYHSTKQLQQYGLEILGARINENYKVEVLMTCDQSKVFYGTGIRPQYIGLDQKQYEIPGKVIIGELKINRVGEGRIRTHYGQKGDIYITMNHPQTNEYIEVVIDNIYHQQEEAAKPEEKSA